MISIMIVIIVILVIIIVGESEKGTNGVSTTGVTANVMLFGRGTFWVCQFLTD